MSEGKEGERPGIRLQQASSEHHHHNHHHLDHQASTDSGLLDLGDVSNDLAALAQALSPGAGSGHSENSDCGDSNTDCDYDNLSSPGGSSTCSGPTYRRHAGFGPDLGNTPTPRSGGGSWPPSPLNKSLSQPQIGSTVTAPRPRLSRLSAQHTLPDNVRYLVVNGDDDDIDVLCPAARRKSERRRRRIYCLPISQNRLMCADCRSLKVLFFCLAAILSDV